MTGSNFAKAVSQVVTLLAVLLVGFSSVAYAGKPNVILILTDDQGYGDLSCHGNPILKTPVLDRLQAESVRFTDFHSAPMCTPTRSQILTGRDAMDNGATMICMGRSMVRPELPTMANIFADSGYRTVHFGKWHLGDSYPYRPHDRGFQHSVHHGAWGITSIADYFGNDYWDDTFRVNNSVQKFDGYCTDVWFNLAIDYIQKSKETSTPFFMYLANNCPHAPHWVDDRYSEPYANKGLLPAVQKFFGQIANIDENMGRLLKTLDETELANDTILIYTTDNGTVRGYNVFNAGMRGHKTEMWEGGHRVPLFVRWPNGKMGRPRDIDTLTQCQDLLPTLIDLCELNQPTNASFDGTSLAPLLQQNGDLEKRMLVVSYGKEHKRKMTTVMWEKWRLVGVEKLYNVAVDPHQDHDVAASNPDIVSKMTQHYESWWQDAKTGYEQPRRIILGSAKQNPITLYSPDWQGDYADNNGDLFAGNRNGYWDVTIDRAGTYEFTLTRWHPASKLALAAPLKGKGAVPIAKARLRIADFDEGKDLADNATEARFTCRLEPGNYPLRTNFLDAEGKERCGAYYTQVVRQGD